jgi:predicted RNase H-like HicB family nuclease
MRSYVALIHKDANSDFGVSFPDIQGIATAGVDLDDARAMAEEALALHIEGLEADGEAIPEPSSLEAIMADPENRSGVAVLVNAPQRLFKVVRINVTVPEDELERIDRFASTHGYTRSGFLLTAARREMQAEKGGVQAPP